VATICRINLGFALTRRGSVSEGRAILQEAVRSAAARGDRRVEGCARTYLAIVLEEAGQSGPAETEARAAAQVLSGMPALRALAPSESATSRSGRASSSVSPRTRRSWSWRRPDRVLPPIREDRTGQGVGGPRATRRAEGFINAQLSWQAWRGFMLADRPDHLG